MNITVAIDDIHPEKEWGIEGDECMFYLNELNKEFGVKFTLFIPSNYHYKFPISEYKDWIDWLKSKKYFELAAHGHYHECKRDDIWECEFFELETEKEANERIKLMMEEWDKVNHKPLGWRSPGWLTTPIAAQQLSPYFKYAAIHETHNRGIQWGCKMVYGAEGIHETDIRMINGNVMFQSHIAGDWNDNCWNKENYEQMRISLQYLTQQDHTFKTISELI